MRTMALADGTQLPVIGQGTWRLGERREVRAAEVAALRAGVEAGMTLIDTAEMYANGGAERVVGEAIRGFDREKLFLVSKVYPHNAHSGRIEKSLDDTLSRMRVDYLDLYLLHWRGGADLEEVVECMERLCSSGKIRRWGVSNFDREDMEELLSLPCGTNCVTNQVLYHVASRGIEYDLLPLMRRRGVKLMAYSPLAQAGDLRRGILTHPVLQQVAALHGMSVPAVMLSFVTRGGDTVAIPRTGSSSHAVQNAQAGDLVLTAEDLAAIDEAFPPPRHKVPLDIS